MSQKNQVGLAVNKSLLKEHITSKFPRTVYMKNGTEFQICLFNPTAYPIGAKISINGDEMDNFLVINPGQRIWLERYLDKSRKFKFETYEIENSDDAKSATVLNGEVKVQFFRKKDKNNITISSRTFNKPIWYNYNTTPNPIYSSSSVLNESNILGTANYVSTITSSGLSSQSCDLGITTSASSFDLTPKYSSADTKTRSSDYIETGRVNEGSYSKQKFDYVDIDFESWPYSTETVNILPESRKVYTEEDYGKRYCTNCGKKLSPKFKYCPVCGTKVE